jgi:hypothetical protein
MDPPFKAEPWLSSNANAARWTSSSISGVTRKVLASSKIIPKPLESANTALNLVQLQGMHRELTTTDGAGRQIASVVVLEWTNSAATHLRKTKAGGENQNHLGYQPYSVDM